MLREAGLLEYVLPELLPAIGVEQGGFHTFDVFDHSVAAVDAAPNDLVTRTAALLHDIGKPSTHVVAAEGKHTFYDHAQVGADMARDILTRWRFSNDEISAVSRLVRLHLRPIQYDRETFGDKAVRRLIVDAGELRGALLDLARADTTASAYPTLAGLDELEERMNRLDEGGAVSAMRDPLDRRRADGPGRARPGALGRTGQDRHPRCRRRRNDRARRLRRRACLARCASRFVERRRLTHMRAPVPSAFGCQGGRRTMPGPRC